MAIVPFDAVSAPKRHFNQKKPRNLIKFFQADKKDTCSRALCECDKKLAEDLAILEDTAQMDYRNRGRLIYFENLNVDG